MIKGRNALIVFLAVLSALIANGQESLISSLSLTGQQRDSISRLVVKPLEPGDPMPNILLGQIFGESSIIGDSKVDITTFKGKLLILDFWSNWCASCIAQFPKLKKLQDKFGDAIQILPIGFSTAGYGDIFKTLHKWKGTYQEMKLPTIIEVKGKSYIQKLFPFQTLPHIVWIDKNGFILAITDHYSLNEENIEDILIGDSVKFKKKKRLHFFDPNKTFIIPPPHKSLFNKNDIISSSTAFIDDLIPSFGLNEVSDNADNWHLVGINSTVFELFRSAYINLDEKNSFLNGFMGIKKSVFMSDDRIVFQEREVVGDNADNRKQTLFEERNLKNYEAFLPKREVSKYNLYHKVIKDMEYAFNLDTRIEQRKKKCFALVRLPDYDSVRKENYRKDTIFTDVRGYVNLTLPANEATERLNGFCNYLIRNPIINETGTTTRVNLVFPSRFESMDILRSNLNKCGFDIIYTEKVMAILVITPKPNIHNSKINLLNQDPTLKSDK